MSDDLHTRLHTVITARLQLAKAAAKPSDAVPVSVWEEGFGKIRRGLEAEIVRHCERDLRVLERHPSRRMLCCRVLHPCPEITDLATVYLEAP